MLPFLLYLLAGVITAIHLLFLALAGAPLHPLQILCLAGSACLIVAGFLSLFKPYTAARLALLASLAMWCFYGPAIARTIRTKLHRNSAAVSRTTKAPSAGAVTLWTTPPELFTVC
jgi:hypothetical protein